MSEELERKGLIEKLSDVKKLIEKKDNSNQVEKILTELIFMIKQWKEKYPVFLVNEEEKINLQNYQRKLLIRIRDSLEGKKLWEIFELVACLLCQVYHFSDVPIEIRNLRNLPSRDTGIDGYNTNRAIQVKYHPFHPDKGKSNIVKYDEIAKFLVCSIIIENPFPERILIVNEGVKVSEQKKEYYQKGIITNEQFQWLLDRRNIENWLSFWKPEENKDKNKEIENNYTLRKYQLEALELIEKSEKEKLLINIACGCGKSLIIAEYLRKHEKEKGLILVPLIELMYQMEEWLKKFGIKEEEYELVGTDHTKNINLSKRIYICVYNSVKLLRNINWNIIFVDEGHHIDIPEIYCNEDEIEENKNNKEEEIEKNEEEYDEEEYDEEEYDEEEYEYEDEDDEENEEDEEEKISFKQIIRNLSYKKIVLLSGTLDNPDYTYNIQQAIEDKYLVDYDFYIPEIEVKIKEEEKRNEEEKYGLNCRMVKDILDLFPHLKKILIYCNRCFYAKKLSDFLNQNGISCGYLDGKNSRNERDKVLREFKEEKMRCISSVKVIEEGIDLTMADCCFFAQTRGNHISICQCVGRILRKCDERGKEMAHIIIPYLYSENEEDRKDRKNNELNRIMRALGNCDKRIQREILEKKKGRFGFLKIEKDENSKENEEKIEEIIEINIFDKLGNITNDLWIEKCNLTKEYAEKEGKIPPCKKIYKGVDVGTWSDTQRISKRRGKLSEERIRLLEEIPRWYWESGISKVSWEENRQLTIQYQKEKGKIPPKKEIYKDARITKWCDTQRISKRRGKLSEERIKLLEEIPGWFWESGRSKLSWEDNRQLTVQYQKEKGKIPPYKEIYKGIKNGKWCDRQRENKRDGKLSEERIRLLEEIPGWFWRTKKSNSSWIEKRNLTKEYAEKEGKIPPRKTIYKEVNIGDWPDKQKQKKRKGKLSEEQIRLLEEIPGWYWNRR